MAPLATQAVHGVYNAKCIFRFGRTIGLPKRRGRPPLTEDRPKRPPRGDLPTHPARTGCGDEEDCEIGDRGFLYLRKNRSPICDSSQIDFLCRVPIAQGRVFTPRCYPQAVHSPITQLSLKLFSIGQDLRWPGSGDHSQVNRQQCPRLHSAHREQVRRLMPNTQSAKRSLE